MRGCGGRNKAPPGSLNFPPRLLSPRHRGRADRTRSRAPRRARPGPHRSTCARVAERPRRSGPGCVLGGRRGVGVSHLVAPLEDVLVAIAEGAVDVEELEDAVLPHVLRVPPRLLPAQRRALRQQPHAGPRRSREEEGERRTENGERSRSGACAARRALCAAAAAAGAEPGATRDGGGASGRDSALSGDRPRPPRGRRPAPPAAQRLSPGGGGGACGGRFPSAPRGEKRLWGKVGICRRCVRAAAPLPSGNTPQTRRGGWEGVPFPAEGLLKWRRESVLLGPEAGPHRAPGRPG